jgi:PLP dependent protein
VASGLHDIGENYAQEARAKYDTIAGGEQLQCRWHFIGQLQRNKVKQLAPFVSVWQTVDNERLITELANRVAGAAVFVQVNLSDDPDRGGCAWGDVAALVAQARDAGLDVRGLMGVGPSTDPEGSRPAFRRLAGVRSELELPELSMGMSGDLEVALEEGSTMVRIGSALIGPRA